LDQLDQLEETEIDFAISTLFLESVELIEMELFWMLHDEDSIICKKATFHHGLRYVLETGHVIGRVGEDEFEIAFFPAQEIEDIDLDILPIVKLPIFGQLLSEMETRSRDVDRSDIPGSSRKQFQGYTSCSRKKV
jgi:hypothetical protein